MTTCTASRSPRTARCSPPPARGAITVWHLATGQDEQLPGHVGFVNDVTFSSDGRMLASAGKDGTVRPWR